MNIAVVNLDSAMAQSAQGRALMQQLNEFQRETQNAITVSTERLHVLRRRMTEGAHILSTEQLTSLQRDFEKSRDKLEQFQQEKQQEGERLYHDGIEKIKHKLKPVLENLRSENEYDLILDASTVLAMADWVDVTQAVAANLSQAN